MKIPDRFPDEVYEAIQVAIFDDGHGEHHYSPSISEMNSALDIIRHKVGVAQAKTGLNFKVRVITDWCEIGERWINKWDIIVNDRVISAVPESCLDFVISGIVVGANSEKQENIRKV